MPNFANDAGLQEVLPGAFQQTDKSGTVLLGSPGESGFGYIKQGWLEVLPDHWTWDRSLAPSIFAAVFAAFAFFISIHIGGLVDWLTGRWILPTLEQEEVKQWQFAVRHLFCVMLVASIPFVLLRWLVALQR